MYPVGVLLFDDDFIVGFAGDVADVLQQGCIAQGLFLVLAVDVGGAACQVVRLTPAAYGLVDFRTSVAAVDDDRVVAIAIRLVPPLSQPFQPAAYPTQVLDLFAVGFVPASCLHACLGHLGERKVWR